MKTILFLTLAVTLTACPRSSQNEAQMISTTRGKALYETHCAPCHGDSGMGDGALARLQWPRPRDFTAGIFKYRATRGPIPSDTDLLQTMKIGIPGAPMPGWDLLSLNDWKSILSHVKTLIPGLAGQRPGEPFEIPTEPKSTATSIQIGRELFVNRGCVSCHGSQGAGDGPAAAQLKDAWGNTITPRDLAHGLLKWGISPKEIYRTLAIGVPGTPMPAFEHTFAPAQLWALVHYIKSIQTPLPKGYDPSSPKRNLVSVAAARTLPIDPTDSMWDGIPAVPVFLKPLWARTNVIEWVNVKAVHDDKTVTFLLSWLDTQGNGADSQNGVALEFPIDPVPTPADIPFVGMGNSRKPVALWLWKNASLKGFVATGFDHMTPVNPLPAGISGKAAFDHGERRVLMTLPLANLEKTPDSPKAGYMGIALWGGGPGGRSGPETFSEWMIYELK